MRTEIRLLREEVGALKQALNNSPTTSVATVKTLDIGKAPIYGNREAGIAIVEFSDYQCSYCARHYTQTFPQLDKQYIESGKVQYIAKQFPLDFHAKAKGAAIAALCLSEQKPEVYWQAHGQLFKQSVKLDNDGYLELAKQYSLDTEQFEQCLNSDEIVNKVDQDIAGGKKMGIRGTPAFLIGKVENGRVVDGQLLSGARAFASFADTIDRLLASGS